MRRARLVFLLATLFGLAGAPLPAQAAIHTAAEHAVLMDAATGTVLWQKDGHTPMPPASMSKLMTLDILFERLKDGRVKLTDKFPVSERAWRTGGSKMFVAVGTSIPVEDLIRGIIIQSGNDACVVVAEALGGTVASFVDMMNRRAKTLGLQNSHFVNPDGLPEPPGQLMSAYDLAKLARDIIVNDAKYYHYFAEHDFTWSGIHQPNRNTVLDKFPGADGLKTGYTDAAGFGVVASAVRGGRRLILVLGGLRYPDLAQYSSAKRDWIAERRRGDEAARVLGLAFREFRQYRLFGADTVVGHAPVWQGSQANVPLVLGHPLDVTLQIDSRKHMMVSLDFEGPVQAPVAKGQRIGTLKVQAPDYPGREVPVYAGEAVGSAGIMSRVWTGLRALIAGPPAPPSQ
jgi:D-alanyl-D-alanine carboxypeptidase (penicillin-binding protein 5/6)